MHGLPEVDGVVWVVLFVCVGENVFSVGQEGVGVVSEGLPGVVGSHVCGGVAYVFRGFLELYVELSCCLV